MKSKAWYYRYPGSVYANGPMRFPHPVSEITARQRIRELDDLKRLPKGMEFWPTND